MRGCVFVLLVVGCGGVAPGPLPPAITVTADLGTAGVPDLALTPPPADLLSAPEDAKPQCQWSGAPGTCMTPSACAATSDHTGETGCGSGEVCCIDTPDVADNPPIPSGWTLMMQSQVTTAMTNWAVMILHDPVTYPVFSTTMKTFGSQPVLARVEWHPPDFQNSVVHRGVTLYVPQ